MNSLRLIRKAEVISILKHTEFIHEFIFSNVSPHEFQFRAGQFLMLHIPGKSSEDKKILRAYSLASGEQSQKVFRLLIKFIPDGLASTFFWNLEIGSEIEFTGPFGKLFFPEKPAKQLYFLSTGSGLAPHLSYAETFLSIYPQCHFHFLIGARTTNDFYCQNLLESFSQNYPQFKFEFVLSRPESSWQGRHGYLQNQIESLTTHSMPAQFFICGHESMALSVKSELFSRGISKEDIFIEIYPNSNPSMTSKLSNQSQKNQTLDI